MKDVGMEDIGTRGRLMYAGIGLVFALLLALYFVYQIRVVVLVFLLTLLFSIIVSGPVDFLARRGLGRGLATLVVLVSLILVLGLASLALAPTIQSQAQQFAEALPSFISDVQSLAEQIQNALGLNIGLNPDPLQLLSSAQGFISGDTVTTFASVGASVANVISLMAVVLIATIYAVAQPKPLVNGFVALFPAGRRPQAREILQKMYKTVQRWFLGQLTDMFIVGLLFTVALSIIGVPFALLFGILSGLLAFIPFIGPIISVIPPMLLALVQNPLAAVWVMLAYLAIQFIEGNVVQPVVMSRAISMHPVVVVFGLLVMGTLFGFVGILLAIPLTAALTVLIRELWIKQMDASGTDPDPPQKELSEPAKEWRAGRMRRAVEALFRRS